MRLFDGLAISGETEFCRRYMHKYDGSESKSENLKSAIESLKTTIGELAQQFEFLQDSKELSDREKLSYKQISTRNPDTEGTTFLMGNSNLKSSLKTLTSLVRKYYGVAPVLLIDEYDVPLNNAINGGYYKRFINTYKTLISKALKDNNISFAVVTGCLKISKESIFTGLNNLSVMSVTDTAEIYAFIIRTLFVL